MSDPTVDPLEPATSGRIGPYRLLQILGEGGMGVVYEAEQLEPVRRRVALKLLRIGLDASPQSVARFEAERQALAVMDHRNIARVYDAGTTADGRPWYAMERVAGVPITQFCDDQKLSTRSRLELFADVCLAVQHAHQKGVIHRDLKPSNVLVSTEDDKPVPKVIDFGIAKALGARLTDLTLVTVAGRPLGTPAYMSPEQWDPTQFDVDTRTDIYSLGVMLYELLVGRLPVDPSALMRAGAAAALVLRRTTPDAPSVRYRSLGDDTDPVAEARRTDPRGLAKLLKGDLDWITLKAIEPDRTRRYETAHALAADINRYLNAEPILARPPSTWYRTVRMVQRHRVATAVLATVLIAGIGLSVVTAVQAGRIAVERDRATAEAAKATALNSFLERTLLSPDPINGVGRDVTMVEALDSAVARMAVEPPASPAVEASVKNAIGWAYFKLGLYDRAKPLLGDALRLREADPGPDSADLAQSLERRGALHAIQAEDDSAAASYRRALAIQRRRKEAGDSELAMTLVRMGYYLSQQGDTAAAAGALDEARAIYGRQKDSSGIAMVDNYAGIQAFNRGDLKGAERLLRASVDLRRRLKDPSIGDALGNLAVILDDLGRSAEAEATYKEAIAELERRLGPEHDMVTSMLNNYAILLDRTNRPAPAESIYRQVLAIDQRKFGSDHPNVGRTLTNLSLLLCQRGRGQDGIGQARRAVAIAEREFKADTWELAATRNALGVCLAALKRYDEAETIMLDALGVIEARLGKDHWRADTTRARLTRMYAAWGRPEKAATLRNR